MKKFKKMMALVIAMVMVLAMSSMAAFAAGGDLTVDDKVTVSGFEKGDTVKAYQFITWVDGEGWKLATGITGITLDDITDGLDKDELATLASANNIAKMTAVTGTMATDGKSWEKTCGTMATAGSYLILVTDNNSEHIYNPAVVSADFDGTNAKAVDLSEENANVKKQDVKVDKEADNAPDDYDVQVGDIVPFTVTVTVPQYNTNWTEPTFEVKDELSTGLTIEAVPTIAGLTLNTDYKITAGGAKGDSGYTIQFTDTYLKNNASKAVEIKYSAKVGEAVKKTAQVHEETNKVTLTFSNNPEDKNSHKTITDETHHYTFSIDASRMGVGGGSTSELIKVGVDSKGNTVTVFKEDQLPANVTKLEGAEFTLTGVGPNEAGEYKQTATSDSNGRIFFNNLEVGTYVLSETKAPAGYIKDSTTHNVVITAEYEEHTGILKSYTITIDGKSTDHYSATTSKIDSVVKSENNTSFPVVNTKGTELPSTGGMGTTLFYIIGAVLVIGAGVVLVTRRRMNAK